MQRHERYDIYGRRSEGTSSHDVNKAIGKAVSSRDANCLARSIEGCYSLASTHGLIARYYYSDSYLHSLDPWIFLEYFYHRISSIRYTTKLIVLLDAAEHLGKMEQTLTVVIRPLLTNEDEHRNKRYTLEEIRNYVVPERAALLQSLRHALSQAQDHLLRGLPAAQLDAWCQRVLRDSFSVPVNWEDWEDKKWEDEGFDLGACRLAKKHYNSDATDIAEVTNGVSGIFWTLLGLLRKSLHEQGRSAEARKVARAQLMHRARQVKGHPATLPSTSCERYAEEILKWLAPDTDSYETMAPTTRNTSQQTDAKAESIQSLLDYVAGDPSADIQIPEVRKHRLVSQPTTLLGKQNLLHMLCMLVEGWITARSSERFDAHLCDKLSELEVTKRKEHLATVKEALELCRVLSPDGARDSSHDPYYLRFRARLLMANAHLQWRGAKDHEAFREADRLLERARASVSSDDHARLARLEMTWVEGLLLQANLSLRGLDPAVRDEALAREQALASARVDYLRAGDALQRAREHLTRGSREVECWASYQQLWAQYQAEWCLFHLAYLEGRIRDRGGDNQYKHKRALAELAPRDTAALLKRLKRGLNGLQAGLVIKPDGINDPWLRRIWLELLCAGMVYGVTTAAGTSYYEDLFPKPPKPESWPLGIDEFWKHWHLMNARAGLPATIENDSKYCRYLEQPVQTPKDMTETWREDMIAKLREPSPKVSSLREHALLIADRLYKVDPVDPGSSHTFAKTLINGIIELVLK